MAFEARMKTTNGGIPTLFAKPPTRRGSVRTRFSHLPYSGEQPTRSPKEHGPIGTPRAARMKYCRRRYPRQTTNCHNTEQPATSQLHPHRHQEQAREFLLQRPSGRFLCRLEKKGRPRSGLAPLSWQASSRIHCCTGSPPHGSGAQAGRSGSRCAAATAGCSSVRRPCDRAPSRVAGARPSRQELGEKRTVPVTTPVVMERSKLSHVHRDQLVFKTPVPRREKKTPCASWSSMGLSLLLGQS
mmetsp:Transcript_45609/g.102986  ORF Transcript_45609/g.102986 Transcript_45609/m.102986 type:complete len:242 (+) Transcript_45609:738-1463(+)